MTKLKMVRVNPKVGRVNPTNFSICCSGLTEAPSDDEVPYIHTKFFFDLLVHYAKFLNATRNPSNGSYCAFESFDTRSIHPFGVSQWNSRNGRLTTSSAYFFYFFLKFCAPG